MRDVCLETFEFLDCGVQFLLDRRAVEHSCERIFMGDAFEYSAVAQRNYRLAAGQCLDRRHTKVLFTRHQKRACPGVELAQLWVRDTPAEFNIFACQVPQSAELGPVTHN